MVNGGYDDGYLAVPCFWGTAPGSLVESYLAEAAGRRGRALDLGCGEGKNAAALARAGYEVDAIDCSAAALANGRRAFPGLTIRWIKADVSAVSFPGSCYDAVVAYGLFHCLGNQDEISRLIARAKRVTACGGIHIVCTFNDRSQDLRAHTEFNPTLLPHWWYLEQYSDWSITVESDADLWESHPHNQIRHHHSMTRLMARRAA